MSDMSRSAATDHDISLESCLTESLQVNICDWCCTALVDRSLNTFLRDHSYHTDGPFVGIGALKPIQNDAPRTARLAGRESPRTKREK